MSDLKALKFELVIGALIMAGAASMLPLVGFKN